MGKKISDRLLGILGFEVEETEGEYENPGDWVEPSLPEDRGRKSNIVSLNTAQNVKIIVSRPTNFDQVQDMSSDLKFRRVVLVNFENTEKEVARRIVDFMSGSTYALGGTVQKISTYIFAFVPNNVNISGDTERLIHDLDMGTQ